MTQLIHVVVHKVTPVTQRICEIDLVAPSGQSLPDWTPGSHIRVHLPTAESRCYSLLAFGAETGEAHSYKIAVQLEPDGQGGSKFMHDLAVGDALDIEAPENGFPLEIAPAVLLAGGIGVTPLISMAAALQAAGQRFAFHYAGRSLAEMAYASVLQHRFGAALHCDDDPETALDLAEVIRLIPPERHLYVCGPRGMIEAAKDAAQQAGITADHLHFELFDAAAAESGDTAFEVEISDTGQVFTIPPDKTIVQVLETAGIDVLSDCQRGDCGICQVDVISGTPDHRDVVLSEAERNSGKVMQICVSRAKSPRLVLDI